MKHTFLIAEAGVNHNGSLARALDMVDAAAKSGADAIKFQTFSADTLVTRQAEKAAYQVKRTGHIGKQYEMLKALELSASDFATLAGRCQNRGLEFMSTPFDEASLALLVDLGIRRLKFSSGDLTNAPLLLAGARTRLPVIVSTGMSVLDEVRCALGVLAFGFLGNIQPTRAAFAAAFTTHEGKKTLAERVTILHCTTNYPTPLPEANLLAMDTLSQTFELPVGYSDHTEGIWTSVAAAARGAVIIEKHFTLDRSLAGPDHAASLEPGELALLVEAIHKVDAALGSAEKFPTDTEKANQTVARKSLVALQAIPAGFIWTAQNLTAKRPGNGLSPSYYWELLGRPATQDYAADELLSPNEISDLGEPS